MRRAKSFKTKALARDWENQQEYRIVEGDQSASKMTLGQLFQRYAREVSATKRGARWEYVRLDALCRDTIADIPLRQLAPADFADWPDRRLRQTQPSSVNREMVLMSAVFTYARREWGLIATNPPIDLRKPSIAPPRDRRVHMAGLPRNLIVKFKPFILNAPQLLT